MIWLWSGETGPQIDHINKVKDFYRPYSLEGKVMFSQASVCPLGWGGGSLPLRRVYLLGGFPSEGDVCLLRWDLTSGRGGGLPSGGVCPLRGVCLLPPPGKDTMAYGQSAVGTYLTGMHSCLVHDRQWGANSRQGASAHYFAFFLGWKLHENERIWTKIGGVHGVPALGSTSGPIHRNFIPWR